MFAQLCLLPVRTYFAPIFVQHSPDFWHIFYSISFRLSSLFHDDGGRDDDHARVDVLPGVESESKPV